MLDGLRKLLSTAGKGAAALPNELSLLLSGHALTGGALMQHSTPPAVGGYLMDTKAVPIGADPNTPYNNAATNNNNNLKTHVNPLQVVQPSQWQQGSLGVQQPGFSPLASYVNPFDTDSGGMSPFMFGSRNNYQGTGRQANPQVPGPIHDILNHY